MQTLVFFTGLRFQKGNWTRSGPGVGAPGVGGVGGQNGSRFSSRSEALSSKTLKKRRGKRKAVVFTVGNGQISARWTPVKEKRLGKGRWKKKGSMGGKKDVANDH